MSYHRIDKSAAESGTFNIVRRLAVEHGGNGYSEFLHHRPANAERHDWRNHRGTFVLEKALARGEDVDEEDARGWRTAGEQEKTERRERETKAGRDRE